MVHAIRVAFYVLATLHWIVPLVVILVELAILKILCLLFALLLAPLDILDPLFLINVNSARLDVKHAKVILLTAKFAKQLQQQIIICIQAAVS